MQNRALGDKTLHNIANIILPDELVFDVGANVGNKAQWFADRGARVVAVEPQPAMVAALQERFASNPHVTIVPKGLAEKPGHLDMHINTNTPVISTFSQQWTQGRFAGQSWDRVERIEMTTMDALVAEFGVPRYTKIDVEGFEKPVMIGLTTKIGAISLEFTSEFLQNTVDLLWYARGLGYRYFNLSIHERTDYLFPAWQSVDVIIEHLRDICAKDHIAWGDVYAV
jgi:FkbM family methyltransferase